MIATTSSRRPTRLFSSMPKAANCGGRPPRTKVTISGPPGERGERADLLGQQDRVVERGEQDHADGHVAGHAHQARDGGQRGERRGVAGVGAVAVAGQQRVQPGRAGRGGDLHQVARLLLRRVRAHRPLDERALRHRREQALEPLVRGRRGREEEADGGAELHGFGYCTSAMIIDCDGHILEPPDLWEKYLEPRYREPRDPDPGRRRRLRVSGDRRPARHPARAPASSARWAGWASGSTRPGSCASGP